METIGLDLGFRQVKTSTEREDFKFDSVIGYPSVMELTGDNDYPLLEDLTIDDGEAIYYVGDKAIRDTTNNQLSFSLEKTNSKSDTLKAMAAFGYAMGDKSTETFQLVTGLPVDELGIKGLKESLKENLQKTHSFTLNGSPKQATVEQVVVIAQSAGAYYNYVLDTEGKILHDRVQPKVVVIDIGYRTTDVVCMDNARYNTNSSFTSYTGVHHVHQELRKDLLKSYRIQKQPSEMDVLVRKGYIELRDYEISLQDNIRAAAFPYAEKILSELPLFIPNMEEVSKFLITGGGAAIMGEFLMRELQSPSEVILDFEMANAKGYYKYMKLLKDNSRKPK